MWQDHTKSIILASTAISGGALAIWALRRRGAATKQNGPLGTDFEAYLRKHIDNPSLRDPTPSYAPTSFEAYLRDPNSNEHIALATLDTVTHQRATHTGPPPECKPITVLFGTEFGFSREISEKLRDRIHAASGRYWVELVDMADVPEGMPLQTRQAVLIVCSTQGDGVPPTEARDFCHWLSSEGAPAVGHLSFSVCALGDTAYEHFCRCGRTLDARFETLGGIRFAPRVDVHREDWKAVNRWIDSVVAELDGLGLKTAAELGWSDAAASESVNQSLRKKKWSKSRPYYGTVVEVEGLCTVRSAADKNTVRVEIDLGDSDLAYEPGDALGVWPENDGLVVDALLKALGGDTEKLLVKLPSWHYVDAEVADGAQTVPIRDALTRCYDIRSPKPELLELLHEKIRAGVQMRKTPPNGKQSNGTSNTHGYKNTNGNALPQPNVTHATKSCANDCADGVCIVDAEERLCKLLSDSIALEKYLAERHVVDILRDWSPARLTPGELLQCLRQLAPRLYSISSSPLESSARVQVTVAIVRYESLGINRGGVASTWLGERIVPGAQLPVYMYPNPDFRLPSAPSVPIIMVGPGTGVAPFRAFIQHRLLSAPEKGELGEAVLFFGSRRRDQDYLYGELLDSWAKENKIKLFNAFSREQEKKVYVQDRLLENGDLVWRLLGAGGHFYICGDGLRMAADVEKALIQIVEARQSQGIEAAKAYVKGLEGSGRFQKDVWVT